jgi:hypothetical protein
MNWTCPVRIPTDATDPLSGVILTSNDGKIRLENDDVTR